MLENPARKVAFAKRNIDVVRVKLFLRSVPVEFKPGPRKPLEETRTAVKVAYGSPSASPGSSDDVLVVENEIVGDDAPSAFCDLTFKGDRGVSGLQRIKALCRSYSESVSTDVQQVQVLLEAALTALDSSHDGAESLVKHNNLCVVNNAKAEAALKVPRNQPSDAK